MLISFFRVRQQIATTSCPASGPSTTQMTGQRRFDSTPPLRRHFELSPFDEFDAPDLASTEMWQLPKIKRFFSLARNVNKFIFLYKL